MILSSNPVNRRSFALGDQDRLEAAIAVARQIDPDRAALGDHRLAAGAIALVGLAVRFRLSGSIAQVQVHLRTHRPFDHRLLERQEQVLHFARRHRPLHQLIHQLSWNLRQRPSGRCLLSSSPFLGRHIHFLYLSWYAPPTKSRIGPSSIFDMLGTTGHDSTPCRFAIQTASV